MANGREDWHPKRKNSEDMGKALELGQGGRMDQEHDDAPPSPRDREREQLLASPSAGWARGGVTLRKSIDNTPPNSLVGQGSEEGAQRASSKSFKSLATWATWQQQLLECLCSKSALRALLLFFLALFLIEKLGSAQQPSALAEENKMLKDQLANGVLAKASAEKEATKAAIEAAKSAQAASESPSKNATVGPQEEASPPASPPAPPAPAPAQPANSPADPFQELLDRLRESTSAQIDTVGERVAKLEEALKAQGEAQTAAVEAAAATATAAARAAAANDTHNLLRESLFDSSGVHMSVLQNLEQFAEKRWVLPCTWEGCRTASQVQIFRKLLETMPQDKRRRANKDKLRIVQLGACSLDLPEAAFQAFDKRIERYVLVDPALGTSGKAAAGTFCDGLLETDGAKQRIEALRKARGKVLSLERAAGPVAGAADQKYFDMIIVDASPNSELNLEAVMSPWFAKLRNDGVILGHGYGVALADADNDAASQAVTWLDDVLLSRRQEQATKSVVDKYVKLVAEKSDGRLFVGGDTTWFLFKRKVSLSNVFN